MVGYTSSVRWDSGYSGPLHVWLGLKNSDDQGTSFDLKAELYKNSTLVAVGETRCITGVTRNPNKAKEVTVTFAPFAPVAFNGTTDVLALKLRARIGTNPDVSKCSGHSSAVGLRLYYDAVSRPSRFGATFPFMFCNGQVHEPAGCTTCTEVTADEFETEAFGA